MKVCPYCSAQNYDQADICHYCRSDLTGVAPTPSAPLEDHERTQPRSVNRPQQAQPYQPRPASPSDTQPMHGQRPSGAASYPSPYPVDPAGSSAPPSYQSQSAPPYYGQAHAAPAPYPSYPPPAPPKQRSPLWPVLIASLALVLLCAGGFAIWTISRAAAGGVSWLGGRAATEQAADITNPTSAPVAPVPFDTPTPWPTFTSPPVDTLPPPAETVSPDVTEDPAITRLLSPECSAALERLETLSGQITENPTAPLNADWRKDLSDSIADMRTYCGTLENASPVPGILEEAQRNLALASSEFDQATALFNEGVETLSPGKLLEAAQHIGKASEHLRIALAELRKIGQ